MLIRDSPVLSCLLSHGADAYGNGGVFSVVNPAEWESVMIDVAANAVPLMKGAFQVAKTQARKAMLALFMSAVSINLSEAAVVGGVVVGAIVLPKLGFGSPTTTDQPKCPSGTKKNSESVSLCFVLRNQCTKPNSPYVQMRTVWETQTQNCVQL